MPTNSSRPGPHDQNEQRHMHDMNDMHDLINELVLLDAPGVKRLRLRFDGPFEGGLAHWDATLFTPEAWDTERGEGITTRNIIEVGDATSHGIKLQICLQVECIDLPTIRKAVMMVRQYKRLRRGRHEYG